MAKKETGKEEVARRPYEMAHQWVKRLARAGYSVEDIIEITGYNEKFVRLHASKVTRQKGKGVGKKEAYIPVFMKVNPVIGAAYNLLKERGYQGSFADFIHECVYMALGLHPDLVVESDPEILELKRKMRLKELKEMHKRKVDIDKEIEKLLKYVEYVELIENLGG